MIFGRTDLRISLSGAKFDPEADFDFRFEVARQNPRQTSKKRNFLSEILAENFVLPSKKKRGESSETRFGKVCRPCELRSRRKHPFKVSQTAVANEHNNSDTPLMSTPMPTSKEMKTCKWMDVDGRHSARK